jgi:hypothetical protein
MNIQAIINKKLGPSYAPFTGTTVFAGDDPASQASWLDVTGLPGK